MTALPILAIVLSVGAIAFCAWAEILHDEEDLAMLKLIRQHDEIMRHMANCMGLLDQRIKILEEEAKKGDRQWLNG